MNAHRFTLVWGGRLFTVAILVWLSGLVHHAGLLTVDQVFTVIRLALGY